MKIITICGSLRFKDEIISTAFKLELEGNVVLTPVIPDNFDKDAFNEEEFIMLGKVHKEKIFLSDAVYIINKDNYIGESTQSEIDYAKSLGKEIYYYSDDLK